MPDYYSYRHKLRICNTYCFSTLTMVTQRVSMIRYTDIASLVPLVLVLFHITLHNYPQILYAIGNHQTCNKTCSAVALTAMSLCRRQMVNSGQVQRLGRLAADFPPRTHGFHSTPVHMGFMVNKVTLKQGFLQVFLFSPTSIIPRFRTRALIYY
jgi:hypothetical protein